MYINAFRCFGRGTRSTMAVDTCTPCGGASRRYWRTSSSCGRRGGRTSTRAPSSSSSPSTTRRLISSSSSRWLPSSLMPQDTGSHSGRCLTKQEGFSVEGQSPAFQQVLGGRFPAWWGLSEQFWTWLVGGGRETGPMYGNHHWYWILKPDLVPSLSEQTYEGFLRFASECSTCKPESLWLQFINFCLKIGLFNWMKNRCKKEACCREKRVMIAKSIRLTYSRASASVIAMPGRNGKKDHKIQ